MGREGEGGSRKKKDKGGRRERKLKLKVLWRELTPKAARGFLGYEGDLTEPCLAGKVWTVAIFSLPLGS